ncbi:MAG: multicopper oxidase domain-containing protein [Candidatus Eremiobacteraeota bacterium]|nr:multicopper oxidase domain-containing protein [Candidatus Eremiobacteraeota bacterium]
MHLTRFLASVALATIATLALGAAPERHGVVRTYYIAADEFDWDYLPSGLDQMMGMKPSGYAKSYTQTGPHALGHVFRKAAYREYTDATFAHLKPRAASARYQGLLGPTIRAEVGDTIKIVFRNNGSHPYSMHPHGVWYEKASEGSAYDDGSDASAKRGGAVPPGKTHNYTWEVLERSGPGPNDPSSIVWLYHSHADERRDVNSGLIGTIVVTRQGMARADGTPSDVDREISALFMMYDENQSWFLDRNLKQAIPNPKKRNKLDAAPVDEHGNLDILLGTGIGPSNLRWTVNGYQYANMPVPTMKKGDRVRWYVVTLGEGFNFHTPHWHGNTVLVNGQRTDVVSIAPAQMVTADMLADDPGTWLFHCHVSDHMEGGMVARYRVSP